MPSRSSSEEVHIGKRITSRRLQRGLSQGVVSRRAGIDPSYLSRIETGKVHPTVRTANRIAGALNVSLGELLGPLPPARKAHPCPVTAGGRCLMDLLDTGRDETAAPKPESYSPRQLRLLRRFTHVLQEGSPEVLRAFEVFFSQTLGLPPRGSKRGGRRSRA